MTKEELEALTEKVEEGKKLAYKVRWFTDTIHSFQDAKDCYLVLSPTEDGNCNAVRKVVEPSMVHTLKLGRLLSTYAPGIGEAARDAMIGHLQMLKEQAENELASISPNLIPIELPQRT